MRFATLQEILKCILQVNHSLRNILLTDARRLYDCRGWDMRLLAEVRIRVN